MKGYTGNIDKASRENTSFRKVLYTSHYFQLVLMCLQAGEDIGMETHTENDQFFRFESGKGRCIVDGHEYEVSDGDVLIVPSGAKHNIINTSSTDLLQLYTIYAPPHHKDQIEKKTKAEASAIEAEFDGVTTE